MFLEIHQDCKVFDILTYFDSSKPMFFHISQVLYYRATYNILRPNYDILIYCFLIYEALISVTSEVMTMDK